MLMADKEVSLLELELNTGKTHQLRAQLSALGYPIVGDPRYGEKEADAGCRKRYGISSQLLHSYSLTMPDDIEGDLSAVRGMTFRAGLPEAFMKAAEFHFGRERTEIFI